MTSPVSTKVCLPRPARQRSGRLMSRVSWNNIDWVNACVFDLSLPEGSESGWPTNAFPTGTCGTVARKLNRISTISCKPRSRESFCDCASETQALLKDVNWIDFWRMENTRYVAVVSLMCEILWFVKEASCVHLLQRHLASVWTLIIIYLIWLAAQAKPENSSSFALLLLQTWALNQIGCATDSG